MSRAAQYEAAGVAALVAAAVSLACAPRGVALLALVTTGAALAFPRFPPAGAFAASAAGVAVGTWGLGSPARLAIAAAFSAAIFALRLRGARAGWLWSARWAVAGAAAVAVLAFPVADAVTRGAAIGPVRALPWRAWSVPVWGVATLGLDALGATPSRARAVGLALVAAGAAFGLARAA